MKNKKGQSFGISIMSLIFLVIIGFMCVNFFFNEISTARTNLSCASPELISDGSKLLCLIVDLTIPYWIWIILVVGISFVLVRANL
jgi:hypothetical protein